MSGQGAMIGAAAGATYGLATGKDPIKSAMIGAAVGGTGGAAGIPGLSAAGAGTAAGTAAAGTTAATTAGTTAAGGANLLAVPAFGAPSFSMAAPASSAATGAGSIGTAGIFANPTSAIGGTSPMTAPGPSTGLIGSSLNQPTFMETVGGGLKDIGQYAQDNPVLTQMGMQGAQSLLNQQSQQPAPAGIMRGSPSQAQMPQYQFGPPKISLI